MYNTPLRKKNEKSFSFKDTNMYMINTRKWDEYEVNMIIFWCGETTELIRPFRFWN